MKLKNYLLFVLTLFYGLISYAQGTYDVSGTVKGSTDGLPIPGVNVIIVGTTTGVATDFDGNYKIKVKSGDSLEFSSIGYATKTIAITGQKTINISLVEDSESLDEVVVVGYGKRKKSHLTGSIAKIGGEDVAAVQATRVDEALAGKLSGVLIQNQSGEPGAAPSIKIRAASSISSASNPLIVVDGFPISGGLETVNSNDIESIEVLKDAASAAIYGSRGANGVILVTTKKGKQGKPKFSYNAYTSISSRYKTDNIQQTASEWANTIESNIANGNWDVSEVDSELLDYRINAFRNSPDVLAVEDWLFKNGSTISHDFSMSGGSENVNYFASVGYQNTKGVIITQGFERVNARLNVDAKLNEKFKTGVSFNGFISNRVQLAHDMRDLIRAYNVSPIYHTAESIAFVQELDREAQSLGLDAFDLGFRGGDDSPFNSSIATLEVGDTAQDWHYGRSGNGIGGSGDAGPATKLDNADFSTRTYFANIASYLQANIVKGLDIKTVLGGDLNDTQIYYYQGLEADSRGRTDQTDLDQTDLKVSSVLSETTLSYADQLGEDGKHDISAVAGVEFQTTFFRGTSLIGTNVPFGDIVNYNLLAPEDITITERDEVRTRRSVFGRINYAYDDRYLLSASIRRDGDSRFGENQRFATFPAVSLGWNVHNESFYESNAVSLLKLRVSTGSLGTTSFLGSYQSLSLLNPQATVLGTGLLIPSDVANPDLTWQTNTETNYGIDLGFVNNRFRLSVDYYTSDIQDILLNQSVPEVTGTAATVQNVGDVRSSGLEVELSAGIIQSENFTWNVNANVSTVETEITDLGNIDALPNQIYGQSGRGPVFRNYVGGQIGEMWGIETTGQVEDIHIADPTRSIGINSSAFYVVDQNGDGVIDNTRTVEEGGDLVKIGNNTPDFYWGLSSSMNYKNFDLSFQLQGTHGGEVWNVDPIYYNSEFGGRTRDSFDADDNGIADQSGQFYLDSNNQLDAQIQDASFVALRNLTIGYTFDQDLIEKVGLSSVRLYAAGTNLLYLWSDEYTSYNPEGVDITNSNYAGPTTYGVQVGESPTTRSVTFGLNLNF